MSAWRSGELLEDLIVYDSTGSRPWAAVDIGVRVRDFLPKKRVLSEQRQLLEQLATFDLSNERAELGAARWYLRAVQSGPTPDAVVFLWIAMEALAPPAGKGDSRTEVRRVEEALTEAGVGAGPASVVCWPSCWSPSRGHAQGD
jgi:hypothetical protein